LRIHRHTNWPTARLTIAPTKARNEIHRRSGRATIAKGYEHDFVANGISTIPAAVFAHERAVRERLAQRRSREGDAERSHVRSKAVVGGNRRTNFVVESCQEHGHALGHERQARHGAAGAPSQPYLGAAGFGVDKSLSEETARTVDAEVARIIAESHEQAKTLLRRHRKQLDDLVKALLARETHDEQQILEVTGLPRAPELETGRVAAASSQ
jgi:hypothetical protein